MHSFKPFAARRHCRKLTCVSNSHWSKNRSFA